jgi:hypothetical protein
MLRKAIQNKTSSQFNFHEQKEAASCFTGHKQAEAMHNFTCHELKKVALLAAVDIRLTRLRKSPERCARNLMELGLSAFPDKLTKKEQTAASKEMLTVCKSSDVLKARELFSRIFL